jgi:hypothetical protein
MKVYLSFKNKLTDNMYFKYYGLNDPVSSYTKADMQVPPEFERAIEWVKPIWSRSRDRPLVTLDSSHHGFDLGLVHKDTLVDRYEGKASLTRSEVAVRVSVGGKSEGREIAFDEAARLHIGVYGGRKFFPEDWRRIVPKDNEHYESGVDYRPITPVLEQVHISLRWLDGKFDDWDDPELWLKEYTDNRLGSKRWDRDKANFLSSRTERLSKIRSSGWVDKKTGMGVVRSEGRKRRAIPLDIPLEKLEGISPSAGKVLEKVFGYHKGLNGRIPTIGFGNIKGYLGRYVPYPNKKISDMDMIEGTDYLFGGVLPGILEFAGGGRYDEVADEIRERV